MPALVCPCAITRSTSSSRGVSAPSGDSARPAAPGDQRVDHLRVDHRAARDDLAQRADQVVDVVQPVLEQVGETRCAVAEQGERIGLVGVLRQHRDADRRMLRADGVRGLDALHVVARAASGCRSARRRARTAPPRPGVRSRCRRRRSPRPRRSPRAAAGSPRGRGSCPRRSPPGAGQPSPSGARRSTAMPRADCADPPTGDRQPATTLVPRARRGVDAQPAAERLHPVAQVRQPGAGSPVRHEPGAAVGDHDGQLAVARPTARSPCARCPRAWRRW